MNRDEQGREIRSVCGWCPDARERTEALTLAGYAVSHGCCPQCITKIRAAQVPVPERRTV
jgi:hypothetical protein